MTPNGIFRLGVMACLLMVANAASADGGRAGYFEGTPVGFTPEGDPYMGSPEATVVLEEWSDFLCPFCARHVERTHPLLLERYLRTGRVRLVFRDLPLAALHPTAAQGHVAARCAGRQGAAQFWAYRAALFSRQGEWSRLAEPRGFLEKVAQGLGLDVETFRDCLESPEASAPVAESVAAGQALGYDGTPTFRFMPGGTDASYRVEGAQPIERFADIADALLAGKAPPEEPRAEPPQLPFWARPEGLAPDPERPGYNLAGDPYKGNPKADLVVIEWTDFQCPGCARHSREVQPLIDAEFVDSGRVLWVSKHLPLKSHVAAPLAAAAAECAGIQGRYWEMRQALFADVDRWANDRAEASFLEIASGLGLDAPRFRTCLDGREAMEKVLGDLYDAQDVVRTTPSFVFVQGGRGSLSTTPLPANQFTKLLESKLGRPNAAAARRNTGAAARNGS